MPVKGFKNLSIREETFSRLKGFADELEVSVSEAINILLEKNAGQKLSNPVEKDLCCQPCEQCKFLSLCWVGLTLKAKNHPLYRQAPQQ